MMKKRKRSHIVRDRVDRVHVFVTVASPHLRVRASAVLTSTSPSAPSFARSAVVW